MGLTELQLTTLKGSAGQGIGVRDNSGPTPIVYVGTINQIRKTNGLYTIDIRVDSPPYLCSLEFNPFYAESTYDGKTVRYMNVVLIAGGEFTITFA